MPTLRPISARPCRAALAFAAALLAPPLPAGAADSPAGNAQRALGSGGVGAQVNLPLSVALSPAFVSHTNLGLTHVFSARGAGEDRPGVTGWNAGQSFVWLAHPAFNVLLEAVVLGNEVPAEGGTARTTEACLSPGVRFAVNMPGHVLVVPGVAVPLGIGPSRGKAGLFLYLSVELPVFGAGG